MKLYSLAFLALLLSFDGCDQLSPKPKPTPKENRVPVHRFVLTRASEDVAFDTQTGQLCRTWEWTPIGKASKPDPDSGNMPQRKFGEFAPSCLSLYEKYPSGVNTQSEALADE
jgi:hypothetical protein